jgi:hypothetical protein
LDFCSIAAHQDSCAETQNTALSSTLVVQSVLFHDVSVWHDNSMSVARPVIPWSMGKMFSQLSTVLRGTSKYLATRRLLSASVVWRNTWPQNFQLAS